jgi:hypothetical protein
VLLIKDAHFLRGSSAAPEKLELNQPSGTDDSQQAPAHIRQHGGERFSPLAHQMHGFFPSNPVRTANFLGKISVYFRDGCKFTTVVEL